MADALPTCLLNGELIATHEARVSPFDRGFLFADAVYEVVPCYNGKPLRLNTHLERLASSLAALGLDNPYPAERWRKLFYDLLKANDGGDLGVYLQVTRGTGAGRDFLPPAALEPTVFGFTWRLTPHDPEQLKRGLEAVTLEDIRWLRCDIKSTALLAAVMLRRKAAEQDGDEAILIRDGHLAEGSSSAVFVVKDGVVATPPASRERLPSITRQVVGDVLAALGLGLKEREIPAGELASMDEIWIASATREAFAVTRLDGRPVGNGHPGPLWRRVYDEFQALKQRECGA
ncbi:MAG: D-amino acid aminotransferase [Gammaproteobacteria bacterium]